MEKDNRKYRICFIGTPSFSNRLAQEWRKSWNRILRRPFSFKSCGKPVVTESGWIRFPIASTNTYRIGAKQSTLSIHCSTVLTANLKVGKQMGFGDAIRAPDFHCRDFAFVQQLVPRFGADSQGIAHLLDVGEKSAIFPPKKIPSPLLPFALVQATQNHSRILLQDVESRRRVLTEQGN